MGRAARWSYANARLRANLGALVSSSFYRELTRLTLDETLKRLVQTPPYGIDLPSIEDGHSEGIGALLYQAYEDHLVKVSRYLDKEFRHVFILALEHVAVDDIKHLIRRILGGLQQKGHESAHYLTIGRSSIVPDLTNVTSLDSLDKGLSGTVFSAPYRLARSTYEDTGEILAFEVALDLDYHRRLKKAIAELPEVDAKACGKLFRRQCDIKNLGWILRYRFDYQLTEVEIFNYTLNIGYELNDDLVMELAALHSPSRFLTTIAHLPVGKYLAKVLPPNTDSVIEIEAALDKYWEKVHLDALCGPPFGLMPFMAYQVLKELERTRLERIIVGLQLDLLPEDIVDSLWLSEVVANV